MFHRAANHSPEREDLQLEEQVEFNQTQAVIRTTRCSGEDCVFCISSATDELTGTFKLNTTNTLAWRVHLRRTGEFSCAGRHSLGRITRIL